MFAASKVLSQNFHWVVGLAAVADAFAATVSSDVVSMKDAIAATFWLHKAVGATGTSTITVEACDDTVPTTTSAIAFKYRANTATDVWGALTNATSSGFATTAGSNQNYEITVDADQLANSGYGYVRLKCVEVVDSPVLGGIFIQLHLTKPRAITPTQI